MEQPVANIRNGRPGDYRRGAGSNGTEEQEDERQVAVSDIVFHGDLALPADFEYIQRLCLPIILRDCSD